MNTLLRLSLRVGAPLLCFLALPAQAKPWSRQPPPPKQFDLDFRPGAKPAPFSAESPSERPPDDGASRAYHILGMPLNAFLQAMAQRAGANYIPSPEVQGMVNSVFYDLDPLSMAKAGARSNGYSLESLDGVFVVHRIPPPEQTQPPPSTFLQRKANTGASVPPPPPAPAPDGPLTKAASPRRQPPAHPGPVKPEQLASGEKPPRKKAPATPQSVLAAEDKKLVALTKKLARQKMEEKELLAQERQLHRRLQEEERALQAERKATEKALREQLLRAKKAAEELRRMQAAE